MADRLLETKPDIDKKAGPDDHQASAAAGAGDKATGDKTAGDQSATLASNIALSQESQSLQTGARTRDLSAPSNDGAITAMGFPKTAIDAGPAQPSEQASKPAEQTVEPVSEQLTTEYSQAPGQPAQAIGAHIKRDMPYEQLEPKPFESLTQFAERHLGEGASKAEIQAHAEEILAVNPGKFKMAPSLDQVEPKAFEQLTLPGHDKAGNIIYKDSRGTSYVYSPDNTLTLTRADGSGYERSSQKVDGKDVLTEKHFGPKPEDRYEIAFNADGKIINSTRPETPPESLNSERKNLARLVDQTVFIDKENQAIKKNMTAFEARAKEQGLSQDEIAKTYRDLSSILALKGHTPLTSRERVRMVNGALGNAASPRSISQGDYDTCQTTVIEERVYAKEPSTATAILAQIARDGKFETVDGTRVTMDPQNLRAHGEAALNPKQGEWLRSYTSQVFQTAAINAVLTRNNESKVPPEDVRYVQTEHLNPVMPPQNNKLKITQSQALVPNGEKLMDYSKNPPALLGEQPSTGNIADMKGLYRQLTGQDRPDLFLVHQELASYQSNFEGGSTFKNKEELGAYLEKLRATEKGDIYAPIAVHANSDTILPDRRRMPFAGEPSLNKLEMDHHVVSVVDYDPKTQTVKVDASWGNDRDHIEKPLTLEQLYNASQAVSGSTWMDRLEKLKPQVKAEVFDKELATTMYNMGLRWAQTAQRGQTPPVDDMQKTVEHYKKLRAGRTLPELSQTDQIVQMLEEGMQKIKENGQ